MTYVRIPVPRVSPTLGSNLLGLAGLVAIVVAIGALTSWKWGLLAAGVFAVALTVIAQAQESGARATPAGASVAPIGKARQGRISATAAAMEAAKAETG